MASEQSESRRAPRSNRPARAGKSWTGASDGRITVIGDDVNLAARVEGLTRQFNNHIIITEFTYDKVKEIVNVNDLGSVTVKGRQHPVMIYDLVGVKGDTRN